MNGYEIAVVFGCWLLPPVLILVAMVKQRRRARAWRQQDALLEQLRHR